MGWQRITPVSQLRQERVHQVVEGRAAKRCAAVSLPGLVAETDGVGCGRGEDALGPTGIRRVQSTG